MKRSFFLTTLLFLFSISLSWGAIPKTISYQGVLTDPNGVPVPDANYALLFKIYDSSTQLWNETHPIVPVKDGIFNVPLGSITPLTGLAFDRPYDLGITVLPGSEMAPRIPLTASPYSLNPLHSLDAADGSPTNALFVDNNGTVGIGTTSPGAPLHIVADSQQRRVGIVIQDTLGSYPKTWILGNDNQPSSFGLMDGSFQNYRWIVDANGNVGIGTTQPFQKLHVNGNIQAGSFFYPSSRRWKTNIQPISGALDKVQRLRGVSYDWKADGRHDIGVIAEEVGQVIPEVVAYEENGIDAQAVDYARLVAVLIEAVKEQQREIEALKAAVKSLETGGNPPD